MKGLIVLLLLTLPLVQASVFDEGWLRQSERTKISLCYCQLNNGVWVTGKVETVDWIKPYCLGSASDMRCQGIERTWKQDICELPDYYSSDCWLPGGDIQHIEKIKELNEVR